MGLRDITRKGVLRAIAEYDEVGHDAFRAKYGCDDQARYVLFHNGETYPAKAIACAAHGYDRPQEGALTWQQLSDSDSPARGAAHVLAQCGFSVEKSTPAVDEYRLVKNRLLSWWFFSPERLWLMSCALFRRGHPLPAFLLKQLNGVLYHNSLAPGAKVSPDIRLGHSGLGVVITPNVEIGRRVNIWQHVTIAARGSHVVIEEGVVIGANAVVIATRGAPLRIGREAVVGAAAVVTHDVPAGARIVSAPSRLLAPDATA